MKKLYALAAIIVATISTNAQTIIFQEDFAGLTKGNNTSTSGSNSPWQTGNENFPTVKNAYEAGGALRLGKGNDTGSITSKALDLSQNNGNFKLSFKVKGWHKKVEGDIIVSITDQEDKTVTYSAKMSDDFETFTLEYTGGTKNSIITIGTSAKRAFIDDIKVETDTPLAVENSFKSKTALVKNTTVKNQLYFATTAEVKIFNMNGQLMQTASVKEGQALNLSQLTSGIYLVNAVVNGEKISQKIIKN